MAGNVIRELIVSLGFDANTRGIDQMEGRIKAMPGNVAPVLGSLRNMIAGAFAGMGAIAGLKNIIDASDNLTKARNRLGEATTSPENATSAFEEIYKSARQTGVAVEETAKSFMRFAPAMRSAGSSDSTIINMLDGLQKALLSAGSTAAETGSVLQQLSQAVNSNNFAGDELKSFLENAPSALIQEFANALKVSREELKKLGSEGKLTNANVLPALIAAAQAGRDAFGRMIVTVDLATARSKVAWTRFADELNRNIGINAGLVTSIAWVGDALDRWRERLPMITKWIDETLGFKNVVEVLAIAIGTALIPVLITGGLALLPWIAGAAGFALLATVIQDIYRFTQGKSSLFGDLLNSETPNLINTTAKEFSALRDVFNAILKFAEPLDAEINAFVDSLGGPLATAMKAASDAFDVFKNSASEAFDWIMRKLEPLLAGIRAIRDFMGGGSAQAAAAAAPSEDASQYGVTGAAPARSFRQFLADNGWNFASDMPTGGNGLPAAGPVGNSPARSYTSTNSITQQFTITAPDAAGLAAEAGRLARSGAESGIRLGDSFARSLSLANPTTEAGAR